MSICLDDEDPEHSGKEGTERDAGRQSHAAAGLARRSATVSG